MSKVNILILNWSGEHLLNSLQDNLFNNLDLLKTDYKIYVRDNGSTDNSLNILNNWKNTNILKISHNRDNYSVGMNSLFNLTNAEDDDLLLFLNNDVIFLDNWSILKMIELMNKTNAAVVGARLMNSDNKTISHSGVIFSKKYGNMCWHLHQGENLKDQDKLNRKFQAVTGACMLVKTKNFKKAGMFDEKLSWAFEDVCLNLDISINQKELIAYCGETNIIHHTSHSLKKNPVNKLFMQHNVNYFKQKWAGKYIIDHDFYLNDPNHNVIR